MKVDCVKAFAAVAAAVVCSGRADAAATLTANNWQKVGGVFDGIVTNEAHWSLGHVPTTGERLTIHNLSANFTVTFPEGVWTNAAGLYFNAAAGKTLTLSGIGSSWLMPSSEDLTELYTGEPIDIRAGSLSLMKEGLYKNDNPSYGTSVASLSNFLFIAGGTAADPTLTVDGGVYDFRDPDGSGDWASSTAKTYLLFGSGEASGSTSVTLKNGASVRAWNVGIQAAAPVNVVTFDCAQGYFETLNMPNGNFGYNNSLANRSLLVLTNGTSISTRSMSFGHRANKDVRILVAGEGTELTVRGDFTAANTSPMAMFEVGDGATARFQGAATFVGSGGGTNLTRIAGGNIVFGSGSTVKFGQVGAANIGKMKCDVVGDGGSVSSAVKLEIDGNTHVATTGTVWNLSGLAIGGYGNGGTPRVEMHGGSLYVTNATSIAAKDDAVFVVDGGKATFAGAVSVGDGAGKFGALALGGETLFKDALNLGKSAAGALGSLTITGGVVIAEGNVSIGSNNGATGTVTIAGGTLSNDFASTYVYLAQGNAASFGELNISGGEMFARAIYAGWKGHCAINVSGGLLRIGTDFRLGSNGLSDGAYDVMTVSGGTVECAFNSAANIGQTSPGHAKLRLNGGRFVASGIKGGNAAQANGGSGRADFEADGGTIAAASDCTVLSKFDSAVVNAGGLTIDTQGHSVTIDQSLTGTGVLTLTGGGTVTFAPGITCGVAVVVTGGTKVDFGGVSPRGLTLGGTGGKGILAATLGSTVAVDGDIVIVDFALDLSGTLVKDEDYAPLLTCTGTFDAASQGKWADYLLDEVVSDTESTVFAWTEAGGVTSLTVKRTDKVTHLIEVREGTSNIVWAVSVRADENQEVAVSNGAVCVISGNMAKGRLVKTGPGRLELSGSNTFFGGFDISGGLLKILSGDSLGDGTVAYASSIGPATLEVAASAGSVAISNQVSFASSLATDAAVFKTEGDLSMPIPRGTAYGTVFKRGAGRLTFTCDWDGNKNVDWSRGHLADDNTGNNFSFPANQPSIPLDAETGLPPADAPYGKLTVAEGELVLRGTGSGTKATFQKSPVFVGYPTAERSAGDAQPALVLDNVYCAFGGAVLRVGDSINSANPWVVEPKVVVTNNATLSVNTLHLTGSNANNTDCSSLLYVEDSTVDSYYAFESHSSNISDVEPRAVFVNSRLYSPRLNIRKPAALWFTNSVVALSRSGSTYNGTKMTCYENSWSTRWTFSCGSIFCVTSVVRGVASAGATAQVFTFDDSEWRAGTGTFAFSDSFGGVALDLVSVGRGLVLSPAQGETWTFDLALRGEGGFVKRGAGTVVFDGQYAGQKGRTVAEEGVLDLGGTTWNGAVFGGGDGLIANGVLRGATIALEVSSTDGEWVAAAVPTFSGCAFASRVRVDLGRTQENPIALPCASLVVARYTGAAPNMAFWRLAGTGIPKTGGKFTAVGGEIRVEVGQSAGAVLIVR